MNARQLHIAWVFALTAMVAILIGFGFFTERIDPNRLDGLRDCPGAPVVFIGSSLVAAAVPPAGSDSENMLEHGSHVRFYLPRLSEIELIRMLEFSSEKNARVIFIEAYPLCRDFSDTHPTFSSDWRQASLIAANKVQTFSNFCRIATRDFIVTYIESPHNDLNAEFKLLDRPFKVSRGQLEQLYPLHLRDPRELPRLTASISRAKNQGTRIVLVAPPRSKAAADYLGKEAIDDLERHLLVLADRLHLQLFYPQAFWPNRYFIDHAHLNRSGRERFCLELAKWSDENL